MTYNCTSPASVRNGYIAVEQPYYNHNDVIYYVCNVGYYVDGNPLLTCDGYSGNWSGSVPKCSIFTTTTFADSVDTEWKLLAICVLVGVVVLVLLLIVLLLVFLCLRLCRRKSWRHGNSTDHESVGCCYACCTMCCMKCCCKRCSKPSTQEESSKTSRVRKNQVVYTNHSPPPPSESTSRTLTPGNVEVNVVKKEMKIAREVVDQWKPFANPVRQINTSTK